MTRALFTTPSAAIDCRPERTVLAARIHHYHKQPLFIDQVPRPVLGHGQVLVRVAGTGFRHRGSKKMSVKGS